MPEPSPFISSCTRRELARRRPGRTLAPAQLLLVALVIVVAVGAFIAAHGGL